MTFVPIGTPYREPGTQEPAEPESPTDVWENKMFALSKEAVAGLKDNTEEDTIDRDRIWSTIIAIVTRVGTEVAIDTTHSAPVLFRLARVIEELEGMWLEKYSYEKSE